MNVAVLGVGGSGLAFAATIALRGCAVRVWSSEASDVESIANAGGVVCEGAATGFASFTSADTDLAATLDGADVVIVTTSAAQQRALAQSCAPHLNRNQIVLLVPGKLAGALEFRSTLLAHDGAADVVIAETSSAPVTGTRIGPINVHVKRIKRLAPVASLPAGAVGNVVRQISSLLPSFTPALNTLETGLQSVSGVLHPATLLFNASRSDANEPYEFYLHGITPFVARFNMALDNERMLVASTLGLSGVLPLGTWLKATLGADGDDLNAWKSVYTNSPGPNTMNHRYVLDDVPYSLVPLEALATVVGVHAPATRSVIDLCSVAYERDFRMEGRNVNRLGLDGASIADLSLLGLV